MNQLSLKDLPNDYIMEVLLETGYPKFLSFCESDPIINKICNNKYLWDQLLKKDYYNLIGEDNFLDPKKAYILMYKNYNPKYTLKLFEAAIQDENLELVISLLDHINNFTIKYYLFDFAMKSGSFDIAILFIKDKKYDLEMGGNRSANYLYKYYDNPRFNELLQLMINDKRFNKIEILVEAVKNYDFDIIKLLINKDNVDIAFDNIIIEYEVLIPYMLNNYNVSPKTIENKIVSLDKMNNINDHIIKLLLDTNKHNNDRLLISLAEKNNDIFNTAKYITDNYQIKPHILNMTIINYVKHCNVTAFDYIYKNFNINILYDNASIISKAKGKCFNHVMNTIVNYNNIEEILRALVSSNVISNLILEKLLNSKFLGRKNRKNKNILQNLLLLDIKNNDTILLILDKIDLLDNNILDEYLSIMSERGDLLIINKLLDFQPQNIVKYFEIALDNGNIMAAVMISNYNMCEYINDYRVINFLEEYIDREMINVNDFKDNCDILEDYIKQRYYDFLTNNSDIFVIESDQEYYQINEIDNFATKYDMYNNFDDVYGIIQYTLSERYSDM